MSDIEEEWCKKHRSFIQKLCLTDREAFDYKEHIEDYITGTEPVRSCLNKISVLAIILAIFIARYYFIETNSINNAFDLCASLIGFVGTAIASWGYLLNNS